MLTSTQLDITNNFHSHFNKNQQLQTHALHAQPATRQPLGLTASLCECDCRGDSELDALPPAGRRVVTPWYSCAASRREGHDRVT